MARFALVLSITTITFFYIGSVMNSLCFAGEATTPFRISPLEPDSPSHKSNLERKASRLSDRSIDKFLQTKSTHGTSFRQLKAQGDNLEKLTGYLNAERCGEKKESRALCSRIVSILGAVGGKEALQGIKKLLSRGNTKKISAESGRLIDAETKADALVALGYWVNASSKASEAHKGSELQKNISEVLQGLTTLVQKATNNTAKQVNAKTSTANRDRELSNKSVSLPFDLPFHNDDKENIYRLARSAILGLGLSGSEVKVSLSNGARVSVKESLERYLTDTKPGTSSRALVLGALIAHNEIAKVGISCYYDKKENQKLNEDCKQAWSELEFPEDFKNIRLSVKNFDDDRLKDSLETLLSTAQLGSMFRAIVLKQLSSHNMISKVGEACFYELEIDKKMSSDCKKMWVKK